MAVSLGYFDSLMSASVATTSSELSEADLARAGAPCRLVLPPPLCHLHLPPCCTPLTKRCPCIPAPCRHAGIAGGLVRLSVGLTGSMAQRWAQLEAAYRHVVAVPLGARPTYKAAALERDAATGALKRTPSWHSFGSPDASEGEDDDGSSGAAAAAAAGFGPGCKIRRLADGVRGAQQ